MERMQLDPPWGGYLCDLYGARNMFFVVGAANAVCTAGYSMLPESMSVGSAAKTGSAEAKQSNDKAEGEGLENENERES